MTNSTIKPPEESRYNSIVPIYTSTASGSKKYGTGFVIDKCENSTYILTAYHTLLSNREQQCEKSDIYIIPRGYSQDDKIYASKIVTYNESFDLVVIKFDSVWECDSLPLNLFPNENVKINEGTSFFVSGYYLDEKTSKLAFTPSIEGEFDNFEQIPSHYDINRYYVKISNDRVLKLQGGHSGSPIFNEDKRVVIGVLLQVKNKENNQNFRAISIDALSKFWYGWSKLQLQSENQKLKEELVMVREKENQNHELLQLLHQEIKSLKEEQIKICSGSFKVDHVKGKNLKNIQDWYGMNRDAKHSIDKQIWYKDREGKDFCFGTGYPEILLSMYQMDTENRNPQPTNTRINFFITYRDKRHFKVTIQTYEDSYIHTLQIYWIAFGK